MKKIQCLFAFLCLAIISCNPSDDSDSDTNPDTDFTKNFGASASRDFIGQVVDVNNQPIQNARISIGTSSVQTDVNGVFIINGANVHEKFAYITANKAGYIDGSRAMVPTNGKNNVKIMMIPATPIATIASGTSSEVALPSGTKVLFDGAFETESGAAYSGSVAVSMFHLTPSNQDISSLMPGMLYAQAADGTAKVLQTFGMMQVELRGSGGEKLQIAKTHTAQIKMQIDASQMATAPSSIPLWHFDEAKGYWIEEGSATKVGNQYVGNVSHFSWWNCDACFPTVRLSTKIVDSNGNPISYVSANLTYDFQTASGFTDDDGAVSGLIPVNQILTLEVYSTQGCVIYTSTIGPFSVDTALPDIIITNTSNLFSTLVQGNLLKCDNTNVTNGYVMLYSNYQTQVSAVTNGAFNFNKIYCGANTNFKLKGFDYDSLQSTDSVSYHFATPITNVGNLAACNTVTEFISYKIDNEVTVFLIDNLNAYVKTNEFYINGTSQDQSMTITGNVFVPGVYTSSEFTIEGTSLNIYGITPNTIQFNLSQFGEVGQYLDLTFNGTYTDKTGTHSVTGVAHVRRDN
ncbi:hypothetical protein [Flavobacterium sp.]|uniref:hypothetical protein n=1 Tax=Flavobacterium sp. TaxID=239 RepID=UPI00260F7765|nr:hypothetical protein [Flavobacterium sp.]